MPDFVEMYEHLEVQEFRQLLEDVLNDMSPSLEPFIGLPKEMKARFKSNSEMYQRYVKQRVIYINEREQKRRHFIKWCCGDLIHRFKQLYPDVDYVQLVHETVVGLNELFLERYEAKTNFSLEQNF